MQIRNQYNLPKRSRHYQGMMDVQMLPAGEIDYNKLCDSIMIFICTFDLFGKGKLCYTFENTCAELPGLKLYDGAVEDIPECQGERGEGKRQPSGGIPAICIRPQCTGGEPGSEANQEACGGSKEKSGNGGEVYDVDYLCEGSI